MEFKNDQLFSQEIPTLREIHFEKVEPSYYTARISGSLLFSLILAIVLLVFYWIGMDSDVDQSRFLKIALPAYILLTTFLFTSSVQNFRRMGYAIRERDLVFKRGWLWTSNIIVPYKRIQHSEVYQNPIERMFGLSKLKIYTAGGASSDLSIPGLTPAKAEHLINFITIKTNADEEE